MAIDNNLLGTILLLSALKILLIPTPYRSTDFDVHRNWLAITKNLPISQWYYEKTSIWTLDYPPFFAYFEKFLSIIGDRIFGLEIFEISEAADDSIEALYFQKISVIIVDVVFIVACYWLFRASSNTSSNQIWVKPFLLLSSNVSLLLVDHIHFQYNSFLFSFLILSLYFYKTNQLLKSCLFFVILLNLKHLFLYIAPAFGLVILFRNVKFNFIKLLAAGVTVGSVFLVSLLPVLLANGIVTDEILKNLYQLGERLFPFKRGLTHSYWAPNFWSIYNFIDIVLHKFKVRHSSRSVLTVHPLTSGIIEQNQGHIYQVLPQVTPSHCALTVLGVTIVLLGRVLKNSFTLKADKNYEILLKCIILSGFTSFMFGWHVHEKAILTVMVPYFVYFYEVQSSSSITSCTSSMGYLKRNHFLINTLSTISLFGLFFSKIENILKILFLSVSIITNFPGFKTYKISESNTMLEIFSKLVHSSLLLGAFLIIFFCEIYHPIYTKEKFEFLNLMALSVYCSLGLVYGYFEVILIFTVGEYRALNDKVKVS